MALVEANCLLMYNMSSAVLISTKVTCNIQLPTIIDSASVPHLPPDQHPCSSLVRLC